ncbi:hypothetical protein [Lewinella sp. JB7]|uniref:hypothetical protein n=1 Tax=Lewinella sp. JB7 TaxID=2962887 RepID=UPI0020C998A4|nr:hypothetical protein [Lewinella sp. JB7]MCP9234508.1 hypothetical protein [Lewinella sp. JB7]
MRSILFLCGSLEPGQDGVGDYTRRLAAELQRIEYRVFLIATHDKVVPTVTAARQMESGIQIETLRIPYGTPTSDRTAKLQQATDAFHPEWISLQYVPHAFNRKGIPADLLLSLSRLDTSAERHVMFHELWVTPRSRTHLKDQLLTGLERMAVSLLLGPALRPAVVHTHLPAYHHRLQRKGAPVRPLPLFANIGRTAEPPADPEITDRPFRVAFFSQLATPSPVTDFLSALQTHLTDSGRPLEILLLGGGRKKVSAAAAILNEALPTANVKPIGFRSAHEISVQLSTADLGMTPVLRHEIGKSGTVAAFLTHRLPVAAPCVSDTTPSFFRAELNRAVLSDFSPAALQAAQLAARDLDTNVISVPRIARTMITDLENATGGPRPSERQLLDATLSK